MASLAVHEGRIQPLTYTARERERDLAGRSASRIQYTAGSRAPEPELAMWR